jgi:DNA-binding NarL/FixJ family response regulator
MLVFALSVAAFGWRFGRDPDGLSRVAFYTAPVAIAITAGFIFVPQPFGYVLYSLSPVFMAPALTRRVYGVLHTARPARRITRYMSGVTACVAAFTVWLMLEPPKEIAFAVPALLGLGAWFGVRRSVSLPGNPAAPKSLRLSKGHLFSLAAAVALLFWLNAMCANIHTHFVLAGMETQNVAYTLLGFILPPVGFLLYGIISDKGHERIGILGGMGLFGVGILLTLLPGTEGSMLLPLAFTDGLGGAYTEFFILTFSISFLAGSKRPVFAASLGVVANLLSSALLWNAEFTWLPEALWRIGAPLLVTTAISAVGFVALVFLLFERHREKTLAAALYAMLHPAEPPAPVDKPGEPLLQADFTQQEKEIALLLIEGFTKGEIAHRLHVPATEVSQQMKALGRKVNGGHNPSISEIAAKYNLTPRETNMLRCLCENKSNAEIAAELFLSEETVRIHVRNLMKKLPISSRQDAGAWVEAFGA